MTEETEIWGQLDQAEFKSKLKTLEQQFGQPALQRRLSLQADHFKRHDLDTRIRVTNGKAEVVQKVGNWEAKTRSEICVPLDVLSATDIINLYQILINQLPLEYRQTNIIQYKNYIFNTSNCEIKLGQQTGKETVYHYEIETTTHPINLEHKRLELGLPEALKNSDETFWTNWNHRVNLSYDDLSPEALVNLINKYLDGS